MSASAHATLEELEALARGELSAAQVVSVDAHLAECEGCQRELSWIRAEAGLLSRRPRAPLPAQLWRNIEAQLPIVAPIPVPAPPRSAQTPRPSRPRGQVAQWFAVAAAAAAMLVVYSVGGAPLGRLRQSVASLFGSPTSPPVIISVASSSDDDVPPDSTMVKVNGPVTLRVSSLSADIEAVAGDRERVRMEVTDSSRKTQLELRSEGTGELRAFFNGHDRLSSGHIKLELPPGSRLEVATASGSLTTSAIGGDVRLQTASGDVHVRDARKLELDTASGDLFLDNFSGPVRIRTASGDAIITRGSTPLTTFDWNSTSGELTLDGRCAADCRLNLQTVSGDVGLHTSGDSSYTAHFHTMTGDLEGPEEPKKTPSGDEEDDDDVMPRRDRTVRVGGGAGVVTVNTVSGDLSIGTR